MKTENQFTVTAPNREDTFIEYSVRPVTRYIITRFSKSLSPCMTGELVEGAGSDGRGEYDNANVAFEVACALASADRERMGWPRGDGRIVFPDHPDSITAGLK